MRRSNNNYFKMLEEQVEFCVQASDFLVEILTNYSPDSLGELRLKMHGIEQKADDMQHVIISKLFKEFITPIDQEDILRLVQIIDDITDALDQVMLDLYMFHVDRIPEAALRLAGKVNECVRTLRDAIMELKNFKKPEKLRRLLVKVNDIESEADALYVEAMYQAFSPQAEMRNILGIKAVYDSLENCCDLCEKAADVIEETIMKNL